MRRPLTARAVAVVAQTHNPADAVTMLKRPPTRIELKPEDREEYFAQKAPKPEPPADPKPSDKAVRIGLTKPR